MSVNVLLDMNLSPDWVPVLQRHGWTAIHWSTVGDPRATDRTIMDWAVANGFIVFTHDLDFGTTLALTHARGPSVLQIRAENILPDHMENLVIAALHQHDPELAAGALVVLDESKCRVRTLPMTGIRLPPNQRNL
jgi:predicted nuclease of predicted toxin-antitoxin system